jgi:uncharacterized protein YbbK (DUF523 family)
MRILVSACMLGAPTRYNGESKPRQEVIALLGRHELIPVCPEQLGGLPTPRLPSEICRGRVYSKAGEDVTDVFDKGAEAAAALCRVLACDAAVLKANSPSCGSGAIYDGTFSGRLVTGDGILAQKLKRDGIPVYTETDNKLKDL